VIAAPPQAGAANHGEKCVAIRNLREFVEASCLAGDGVVAITSHYDPLALAVTPEQPVITDPDATVAWSARRGRKWPTYRWIRCWASAPAQATS
jgi:methyl coenzyme M reductase subunit C